MKNNIEYKIYAVAFLVIIFVFGFVTNSKLINFYVNDVVDYNEWVADTGNKLETDYVTNFYGKLSFINYNGLVRKYLNQHEMNNVVKLNNGYLTLTTEKVSDENLKYDAEQVAKLQKYLRNKKIDFLYVSVPGTNSKYDSQLPEGVTDYTNENIDTFISELSKNKVNYIDMREEFKKDNLNQYDYYYKTDHHWTTEGGFYAYQKIMNNLEKTANVKTDKQVYDLNNYNIKTYKNWHLGSNGQRVGTNYTGIDDFDLITPKFDTEIINSAGAKSSFSNILINKEPLQNSNYESRYTYDYTLQTFGSFVNNKSLNKKNILILSDSMGRASNPYLILSFENNKMMDAYGPINLNEVTLNEYEPDVVVILHYSQLMLKDTAYFNFGVLNK